ncbi:hypothetical protein [Streptomyces peucetius]|uniref:Uncharacterized protein n=1 Tax=Streptomyces peucetius TaxID=1950 RepID=A0ABY6I8L6_STRPE|nr:hypothetical protein [Streptomyces peucetius]UYQ63344.1 hypothetical protein OGH68_18990 [Streptomyces peucetius]
MQHLIAGAAGIAAEAQKNAAEAARVAALARKAAEEAADWAAKAQESAEQAAQYAEDAAASATEAEASAARAAESARVAREAEADAHRAARAATASAARAEDSVAWARGSADAAWIAAAQARASELAAGKSRDAAEAAALDAAEIAAKKLEDELKAWREQKKKEAAASGDPDGSGPIPPLDDSKPSCALFPVTWNTCSTLPHYYGKIDYPAGYRLDDKKFLEEVAKLSPYDIGDMWMSGIGQFFPHLVFGPGSKMVRMIAASPHNKNLERDIAYKVRGDMYSSYGPSSKWHPAHRSAESVKDILGLLSGGRVGSGEFETVVGSWTESYQILKVNEEARTVTINFKATNNTDWRSFCHDYACPGTNTSRGVGAGIRQDFYWTKVISWDHLS